MPARHDQTGRSKVPARFIRLEHWIIDCAAWRDLSSHARAAWLELAKIYNGSNNGRLGLDVFTLGERMGMSKSTASRALNELEINGFIRTEKLGSYSKRNRLACEYRMTHLPCDLSHKPPSKEFANWKPDPKSPTGGNDGGTRGNSSTSKARKSAKTNEKASAVPTGATVEGEKCPTRGNHISYHTEDAAEPQTEDAA